MGVSRSSSNTLEYTLGGGFSFREKGRFTMAVTREDSTNRNMVTGGFGWSFE